VPGAIGIPVAVSGFANRAGFVLDPAREIVVLAGSEPERADAVRLLGAVGFDRLAVFTGALPAPLESFAPIAAEDLDDPALQVIDVRERDESLESVPGALLVPYRELGGADLSALDPARPVVPVCASGVRAAVAATLLARRGFRDVRPVLEGGVPAYLLSAAALRATPAAAPASAHTP
jgi:rhodanese-related sulfurtransferase